MQQGMKIRDESLSISFVAHTFVHMRVSYTIALVQCLGRRENCAGRVSIPMVIWRLFIQVCY